MLDPHELQIPFPIAKLRCSSVCSFQRPRVRATPVLWTGRPPRPTLREHREFGVLQRSGEADLDIWYNYIIFRALCTGAERYDRTLDTNEVSADVIPVIVGVLRYSNAIKGTVLNTCQLRSR